MLCNMDQVFYNWIPMSGFDVEIKNIRHLLLGAHVVVENANLLVLFVFCFLFSFLRCYLENTPRNVLGCENSRNNPTGARWTKQVMKSVC